LLARLAEVSGNIWIRFLYGHPESITDGVIDTVAAHPNLCPYFDLPVQHAAASCSEGKWAGHYDRQHTCWTCFDRIRSQGSRGRHPNHPDRRFSRRKRRRFQELVDFVEQVRFDHLGVFTYSDAEDLPSHRLPGHVSGKVAQSVTHSWPVRWRSRATTWHP
jgi:ribosomal protein S12 methylthiotransferase